MHSIHGHTGRHSRMDSKGRVGIAMVLHGFASSPTAATLSILRCDHRFSTSAQIQSTRYRICSRRAFILDRLAMPPSPIEHPFSRTDQSPCPHQTPPSLLPSQPPLVPPQRQHHQQQRPERHRLHQRLQMGQMRVWQSLPRSAAIVLAYPTPHNAA
jgi:hypothetical protein